MANVDNAHLTTSNSILYSVLAHYVRLCTYARRRLLCSELCRHNVRLPTRGPLEFALMRLHCISLFEPSPTKFQDLLFRGQGTQSILFSQKIFLSTNLKKTLFQKIITRFLPHSRVLFCTFYRSKLESDIVALSLGHNGNQCCCETTT